MNRTWLDIIKYGFYIRSNKKDGLQGWKDIKEKYSTETLYPLNDDYIKILNKATYVDDIWTLPDLGLFDNSIEEHHFLIQLFRIAKLNKEGININEQRLIQIAYNIGQLKASKEFLDKLNKNKYFKKYKLFKMNTYIRVLPF